MIPISDDNSQRQTTPYVNYALIVVNVAVFLWVYYLSKDTNYLVYNLSVIPRDIQHCPWSTCLAVVQDQYARASGAGTDHAELADPPHARCSCTAAGSISWATCCSCISSVITWRMPWATCATWPST